MAVIQSSNILWQLSGGATNTDPVASIGGTESSATVNASTIFDDVTGDEVASGKVYYRCVFIKNTDSNSSGWTTAKAWLSNSAPQTGETIAMAISGCAKNGPAEVAANEYSPPSGPSFTSPTTKAGGLSMSTPLSQNDYQAIWIRRSIGTNAVAVNNDTWTLYVEGDSTA